MDQGMCHSWWYVSFRARVKDWLDWVDQYEQKERDDRSGWTQGCVLLASRPHKKAIGSHVVLVAVWVFEHAWRFSDTRLGGF